MMPLSLSDRQTVLAALSLWQDQCERDKAVMIETVSTTPKMVEEMDAEISRTQRLRFHFMREDT